MIPTGFGLAVHACEMAQASNVSMEIELNKLAILPGALDLAKQGFITRANKTNREFSQSMVDADLAADASLLQMIFDPQTSGGLLISVPEQNVQDLADAINTHDSSIASVVGSVRKKSKYALNLV